MFIRESFQDIYERVREMYEEIHEAEERARKEFLDALAAALSESRNEQDPVEEEASAEEVKPNLCWHHSCDTPVPGHQIPWYTTGFE